MEKLTTIDESGNWGLKGVHWNELYPNTVITSHVSDMLYMALCKLKDYEETGLSPVEIESLNDFEKSQISYLLKEIAKHNWISCSKRMPEEYDSIFTKIKPKKWKKGMYKKLSKEVNVTVEFADGERKTQISRTIDGAWKCEREGVKRKVIAWQPLPEPYEGLNMSDFMKQEYSERFDELRKNRVEVSFYKYGPAKRNYATGNIQAIATLEKCLEKYKETGNTEYLCDLANYAMFEFMWPQHPNAYFKATDSKESAGIVGISVREMEALKESKCKYMSEIKLKPCPCCGREVAIQIIQPHIHVLKKNKWIPECKGEAYIECECGISIVRDTEQEVAEAWNTRIKNDTLEKSTTEVMLYGYEVSDPTLRDKLKLIEKALGFRLFTWQKIYIERRGFRRYGKTTAEILADLLEPKGFIDFRKPPSSCMERIYRRELIETKRKLDAAGVKTNEVQTR